MVRGAVIVCGAALVSAAAIGGGLVLAGGDPDVPGADDVHTTAPDCAAVPASVVDEALPDAVPETIESGPQPGGDTALCAWTSLGTAEDPGVLRVEFSALFTDTSGEVPVAGTEHAERALTALVPRTSDGVRLPSDVEGHVWTDGAQGTADLAFYTDNLLVRVAYSGVSGDGPADREDARELTVRVAEQLVEVL
ncbi:hypothetical protein [Nocardiopsis lucentensis]|uniref:hypothetical protein n=1 Tax=Nocardiopsis lucentensis TaxID=53441 RepID=UPI00034CD7AB|nr:hypothetical protein [Nocardiopsis lucentensis]